MDVAGRCDPAGNERHDFFDCFVRNEHLFTAIGCVSAYGFEPALAIAAPGSTAMTGASLLNHMVGAVDTIGGAATARGPHFISPIKRNKTPESWFSELVEGEGLNMILQIRRVTARIRFDKTTELGR